MRKTILGALISSAFAVTGTAHAGLTFDLNGSAAGGVIQADAFDWAPTSFLAQGGNSAIAAFAADNGASCATNPTACQFNVLTHAKLTAYAPTGGSGFTGIPGGFGEITMVTRYTEQVVSFSNALGSPSANFVTTGTGWLEFYWSPASDSTDLTGANFNNGRLIGRLTGVQAGRVGGFQVTSNTPELLDQSSNGDQWGGQQTITGIGSQQTLKAGTTSVDLDPTFFLTLIDSFSITYNSISIGLPFTSSDPSQCFNDTANANAVGSNGQVSTCPTGYTPVIGAVNGLGLASPDFLAQTDYSSSVTGSIPEPASLALVGLALAGLGLSAKRRRQA